MALCTLLPLSRSTCPAGRAGISDLWLASADSVSAFTIGTDGEITAVTMVSTEVFFNIPFEKNTGSFTEASARVKSNVNVTQTITVILPVLDIAARKALRPVFECACGLIAIVKDNSGKFHVAGINTYPGLTPAWDSAEMRTGDSEFTTGADPTADSNEVTVTLVANTNYFAPFSTIAQASIPV